MSAIRPAIYFFLLFLAEFSFGQNMMEYRFNNTFAEAGNRAPDLVPVCPGQFLSENVLLCNQTVYRFPANCGLQFDNTAAGNFLDDEYTIEMYFRFDELTSWKRILDFKNRTSDWGLYGFDGKVNFYNLVTSADAPFYTDKYAHILVTRQAATEEFIVYVDGLEYISFIDNGQEATLSDDNILSFFYDDVVVADEVSSGEVFLIRLYDYVLTPDQVFSSFTNIESQTVEVSICEGESYLAGGQEQTTSGVYTDTLSTTQGCDSIIITNLQVLPLPRASIQREICAGESFEGYSASGIYTDTFPLPAGCDSIRVLELTVVDMIRTTVQREICAGESFDGYSVSGSYTDTLTTSGGCDSIRLLELTVLEILYDTTAMEICTGTEYMGYSESGIYTDTLPGDSGCQLISTLELTVLPVIETSEFAEICTGDQYNGYTTAGVYTNTLTAANGCDSIHTTTISVIDSPIADLTISNITCGSDEKGSVQIQLSNASGNERFILNDSLQSEFPAFEDLLAGTYQLAVLNELGCRQETTFSITTTRCELYIPNAFSPDGDGINDTFVVFSKNADNLQISSYRIFDRWGTLIYEISEGGNGSPDGLWWDGTHRGQEVADGLYVYQIAVVADGQEEFYTGEILLMK